MSKRFAQILLCVSALAGFIALVQLVRQSFAYQPPLHDTLLIRPAVLATFQSVPFTDPDEFEPDSMDKIDDVVEELRPALTALTKKELRYASYKIRSGDSLWELARKNGVRAGTLLHINSGVIRDPNHLPLGKTIQIPNMDAIEVSVKAGDSLKSVAKNFAVKADEVAKFNRIRPDASLRAGDRLIVPNPKLAFQSPPKSKMVRSASGFIWPSSHRFVNSEFGFRMHPIRKRRIFHEGIDIGGGRGATVFSAADGSIGFVGWMRGYGKIVVIRHKDGITTRYAHLSSTRVSRGQRVEQGQIVGTIGATGLATGPNLHFEVRKFGLPQDPLNYLKR